MKKIVQKFREYLFMKKAVLVLAMLYTLGISAILRADFKYIDDLGRVRYGYRGWNDFSRYLNECLSVVLHADAYLTDISPLPQLTAVLILAVAGSVVVFVLTGKREFCFWNSIAVLPMGLSPYFLECFSYKYDSPYMALSVLASVLPLLLQEQGLFIYFAASVAGSAAMCMTYQASSGIFPMLVILLCLQQWNQGKHIRESLRFGLVSMGGYVAGLLLFRFLIMTPVDDYISLSIVSVPRMARQLSAYYVYVWQDLKKWWILLAGAVVFAFVYSTVRDTVQRKWAAFILSVLTLLLMGLVCFGVYPVIETPRYQPRTMYGIGVLIAFLGVPVMNAVRLYPGKLVYLLLCWAFFSFSFTYGNALAEQQRYTDFRIQLVIEDMDGLAVFGSDEEKTVQIDGDIGQSPVLRQQRQSYQILNRLIPSTFGGGAWNWNKYYFYEYFSLKNVIRDTSADLTTYQLPLLQDGMYHAIYGDEQHVLIELKR